MATAAGSSSRGRRSVEAVAAALAADGDGRLAAANPPRQPVLEREDHELGRLAPVGQRRTRHVRTHPEILHEEKHTHSQSHILMQILL